MENIAEKKKAIFEATLELVKENGFHGTPMSMVAKNAGVAAGTIYHYFESKDQLINELYVYNKSRINDAISIALNSDLTYKEKFYKIWTNVYEFYTENTNVLVFFEQYVNSPYNINKCPNYFQGQLFNFFSEGIEKGHIKAVKPEILVVLTIGSITTTAKLNKFGNVPLGKEELKQIVKILWKGMSA